MRCNGNLVDTVDTLQTDNPTCINLLQLVQCRGDLAESTLIYLMRCNGDYLKYLNIVDTLQTDNLTCCSWCTGDLAESETLCTGLQMSCDALCIRFTVESLYYSQSQRK